MKSFHVKCLLAVAALAAAGSVNAQQDNAYAEEPVAVNTTGLESFVAERVRSEAAKGITPLRQYVQRTKFMHQIDLASIVVTREQAALAKAEQTRVAEAVFEENR